MQIYPYNSNISFGLIKLAPADLQQSEALLKRIVEHKADVEQKNAFAINLYKLFVPYLKDEAKQKAKTTYALEEVFADIKLKFWEFIHEINSKNVIDDLIQTIDEYSPSQILFKVKYIKQRLDDFIPNTKNIRFADRVTREQLPVPQSDVKTEEAKQKLDAEIKKTRMTRTTRLRTKERSKGLTYHAIAKEEGVGRVTVRNSVKQGILQIQKNNNAISEENRTRILNLAELLGISFEDSLNIATKHFQIFSSSQEVIERNIDFFTKEFKISKEKFLKLVVERPQLLYQSPETIIKNIEGSAKILNTSKDNFLKICFDRPQYFCQRPETFEKHINTFAELMGIPKETAIKTFLKLPQLLSQNPETLNANVEASAAILGISKEDFISAALKQPALFYQSPQTVNKNVEGAAKIFNIPKEMYIKIILKSPQLFSYLPETLNKNAETTAKHLKIKKEEYIKAASKRPQLFCIKPETIHNNVKTTAKLLGIKISDFIKAALLQPQLFYQKPETINNNVEASAKALGISKSAFNKMALKQPSLFYLKPENVAKKKAIADYFQKLKDAPATSKISGHLLVKSDEKLYKTILIQILRDNCFQTLTKNEIEARLVELLNSRKGTISVEIPRSDFVDDFVKYAENYSKELTGNNIFKFSVKE